VLHQDVGDLAVHFAGRVRYLDAVLGLDLSSGQGDQVFDAALDRVLRHLGDGPVSFIRCAQRALQRQHS
jgi:hypothetical protein|tara:strand:+ start:1097 stop:1303 length:207 start_codon:yes stop_codon:yes gene_type:complete